jgi:DNA polymerase III delta prime subunit
METSLLGQEEAVDICNKALKNPTHLFILGPHGIGKTSLAMDFLKSYAKMHDLDINDKDYFLHLTADQDRGIHTVRAKLADFIKSSLRNPSLRRWVFFDDVDSLPEVSQQALRRPMEQYAHLTCFIFASRSSESLIYALQSRCQPVYVQPVAIMMYAPQIIASFNYEIKDERVLQWLIASSFSSVAEFKRMVQILQWIAPSNPSLTDVRKVCSTHDYEKIIPLVRALIQSDHEEVYRNIGNLWQNGMSFEDILHAINYTTDLYFVLTSIEQERLYSFLVSGWSFYSQSRCSFLDLLCCAQDNSLL